MKQEKEPQAISERVGNAFAVYAVLTSAADMMLRETELQMWKDKIDFKRERKQIITDLRKSIQRTKYLYDRLMEEVCVNSGAEYYDSFNALIGDTKIIVALVMRFYNATYGTPEDGEAIRQFIHQHEHAGLFDEKTIQKFDNEL